MITDLVVSIKIKWWAKVIVFVATAWAVIRKKQVSDGLLEWVAEHGVAVSDPRVKS